MELPPPTKHSLAAQVVTAPAVVVKALVYELYLAAGVPGLDQIAAWIRRDGRLDGALGRDTVARVIGKADIPASQHDVVAVVTVLARAAAWGAQDAAARGGTAQTWPSALCAAPSFSSRTRAWFKRRPPWASSWAPRPGCRRR